LNSRLSLGIRIPDRLLSQVLIDHECFHTQHSLFDLAALLSESLGLLLRIDFTIQKYLLFFLLQQEAWSGNCLRVQSTSFLMSADLSIGFAVEDHLIPELVSLEDVEDLAVLEVVSATRMLESTLFQTILLEQALVLLSNIECLDSPLVFELQTSLRGTVLHMT